MDSSRLPDLVKRRTEAETLLSRPETAFPASSGRFSRMMRISKHLVPYYLTASPYATRRRNPSTDNRECPGKERGPTRIRSLRVPTVPSASPPYREAFCDALAAIKKQSQNAWL